MSNLGIVLTALLVAQSPAAQDPHAGMHARGAAVMGFDQHKTAHHFYLFEDGGAIEIAVKDAADTVNRDAIRAHLPHIAHDVRRRQLRGPDADPRRPGRSRARLGS